MKLEQIKGLGVKRIQKLNEAGIFEPSQLLTRFPFCYASDKTTVSLGDGRVVFCAVLKAVQPIKYIRRGLTCIRCVFDRYGEQIEAVFFNRKYLFSALKEGKTYVVVAKEKIFKNKVEFYPSVIFEKYMDNGIIPIYKAIKGIPQRLFGEAIGVTLQNITINSYISREIAEEFHLSQLNDDFREVHRPQSIDSAYAAGRSIAVYKTAVMLAQFFYYKNKDAVKRIRRLSLNREELERAIARLPFDLTESQRETVDAIYADLSSDELMNRLIEGDVGSGKTIAAFLAMYLCVLSGRQSALMAPTEILASQHYVRALEFFEPLGIKVETITGSQTKSRRDEAAFAIAHGLANVVVGTHALIGEGVRFFDLGLAVTDEQHRFGVNQRGLLENKGEGVDRLVLSATPIPRTLALVLYGDLKISRLSTSPHAKKVVTRFVPENKKDDMINYLEARAAIGKQSFFVCARLEAEDEEVVSAKQLYTQLKKRFGDMVGIVHGQMKDDQKQKAMNDFVQKKYMFLVATTVIEVGLDVADAENIVIFDADRFGLSQLHQLRGRVGRRGESGYCFVLGNTDAERIQKFLQCSDGFELAEFDFAMRGAGDFLGPRQHGEGQMGGIVIDKEVLVCAKKLAEIMMHSQETMEKLVAGEGGEADYIRSLTLN